ncbi:MAG: hypothetical protein JO105_13235 [Hyphomicrobiales bacterium]|nr:hypothetical protein [Hyphomicrobiales bacterium]
MREHAEALLGMAEENSSLEDRACLRSAAQEWLRIAEKLERLHQHKSREPRPQPEHS